MALTDDKTLQAMLDQVIDKAAPSTAKNTLLGMLQEAMITPPTMTAYIDLPQIDKSKQTFIDIDEVGPVPRSQWRKHHDVFQLRKPAVADLSAASKTATAAASRLDILRRKEEMFMEQYLDNKRDLFQRMYQGHFEHGPNDMSYANTADRYAAASNPTIGSVDIELGSFPQAHIDRVMRLSSVRINDMEARRLTGYAVGLSMGLFLQFASDALAQGDITEAEADTICHLVEAFGPSVGINRIDPWSAIKKT